MADPKEMVERRIKNYGWKRDLPDFCDHKLSTVRQSILPLYVDLRSGMPEIYNQGNLGSCTSQAIAALVQFVMKKKWRTPTANFPVSKLFIYYLERQIEGTIDQDAGASIRDGMKVVNKFGCPHETFWPYVISKFAVKPPGNVYYDAKFHKVKQYFSVPQNVNGICGILASGFPIVFGFAAYPAIESEAVAKTGILPMPTPKQDIIGGHAVLLVGYDLESRTFLIRNSWGVEWGMKGYFTMPFDYVLNQGLSDDFWTFNAVT